MIFDNPRAIYVAFFSPGHLPRSFTTPQAAAKWYASSDGSKINSIELIDVGVNCVGGRASTFKYTAVSLKGDDVNSEITVTQY